MFKLLSFFTFICNKHSAFSHDALDSRKCNTLGRPRRFLLTTPVHRRTDSDPGNGHFSLVISPLACDGIRQEVQVLRWTQANQLTDQSTIINRQRGNRMDAVTQIGYSPALPYCTSSLNLLCRVNCRRNIKEVTFIQAMHY